MDDKGDPDATAGEITLDKVTNQRVFQSGKTDVTSSG